MNFDTQFHTRTRTISHQDAYNFTPGRVQYVLSGGCFFYIHAILFLVVVKENQNGLLNFNDWTEITEYTGLSIQGEPHHIVFQTY